MSTRLGSILEKCRDRDAYRWFLTATRHEERSAGRVEDDEIRKITDMEETDSSEDDRLVYWRDEARVRSTLELAQERKPEWAAQVKSPLVCVKNGPTPRHHTNSSSSITTKTPERTCRHWVTTPWPYHCLELLLLQDRGDA